MPIKLEHEGQPLAAFTLSERVEIASEQLTAEAQHLRKVSTTTIPSCAYWLLRCAERLEWMNALLTLETEEKETTQ